MSRNGALDNRQCRLLRAMVADERVNLRQAAREADIADWTVARWMGKRAFSARLKQVQEYQLVLLRQQAAVSDVRGEPADQAEAGAPAARGRSSPPPKSAAAPFIPPPQLTNEEYDALVRLATVKE